MIQDFLSNAIEFTIWAFVAHTALHFTFGLMARRKDRTVPGQLRFTDEILDEIWASLPDNADFLSEMQEPIAIPAGRYRYATEEEGAIVDAAAAQIAAYWQSRPVHNVVPFVRRKPAVVPNLDGFSIRQLKAIASAVRLPRYNSNTKAVLASRLVAEVPTDSLMQAIASITAQAA